MYLGSPVQGATVTMRRDRAGEGEGLPVQIILLVAVTYKTVHVMASVATDSASSHNIHNIITFIRQVHIILLLIYTRRLLSSFFKNTNTF